MEAQCCNLGQVTGQQQLPPQLQQQQDGSMSQASCMATAMGADAGNSQQVMYMCGDMSGMGNGLRPEQQKMWEMKQPQKPGAWQDKYPKSHEQNGPAGPIPPGKMRVGLDRVGPVLEMKARRVDLRPHAKGHEEIDAHRVGVFSVWDPSHPPPNTADFAFDPDFLMKRMPADPEDRARAAAPALNARRSAAVDRLFGAIDPEKTGKIEVRKLLSHLQARRFKKRLDFWSRDGVLVSPDDLDEQLQGMLMSLLQRQSKDVRVQAAFLPSGG